MKKFKPVIFLIPEGTNEVFIDIEQFIAWKKESPVNEAYCKDGSLVLGRQVFVFDVKACDFLFWARYVGEEPRMEICEIEEIK